MTPDSAHRPLPWVLDPALLARPVVGARLQGPTLLDQLDPVGPTALVVLRHHG
jgi:hypothetical protein